MISIAINYRFNLLTRHNFRNARVAFPSPSLSPSNRVCKVLEHPVSKVCLKMQPKLMTAIPRFDPVANGSSANTEEEPPKVVDEGFSTDGRSGQQDPVRDGGSGSDPIDGSEPTFDLIETFKADSRFREKYVCLSCLVVKKQVDKWYDTGLLLQFHIDEEFHKEQFKPIKKKAERHKYPIHYPVPGWIKRGKDGKPLGLGKRARYYKGFDCDLCCNTFPNANAKQSHICPRLTY